MVENQDGPLARSVNRVRASESNPVEERLKNLETHMGISTPSFPADVYMRLKVLEDKIMKIEEFFPQIALHNFNYTGNESKFHKSGRVSRAPGFYKDLVNIRRRKDKVQKEAPLRIDAEVLNVVILFLNDDFIL